MHWFGWFDLIEQQLFFEVWSKIERKKTRLLSIILYWLLVVQYDSL